MKVNCPEALRNVALRQKV